MKKSIKLLSVLALLSSQMLVALPVLAEESSESTSVESTVDETEDEEESSLDWEKLEESINTYLEPDSLEVVYENKDAIGFSDDDKELVTTLNEYRIYEFTNFSRSWASSFGDQRERGGFLVIHFSLENKSDEDLYHNNLPDVVLQDRNYVTRATFTSHNYEDIYFQFGDSTIKSGEVKEGFLAYVLPPDRIDYMQESQSGQIKLPGFRSTDDFSKESMIVDDKSLTIPFVKEAEEKVASQSEFYPDRLLEDNWGTKKLLVEGEPDVSAKEDTVNVTIDGYQISAFEPHSDYASQFEGFEDGVVVYNVRIKVENDKDSDQELDLKSCYAKLILGDLVEVSHNAHLNPDPEVDVVKAGEEGVYYMTFLVDGKLYGKFEDDAFSIVPFVKNTKYEYAIPYESVVLEVEVD